MDEIKNYTVKHEFDEDKEKKDSKIKEKKIRQKLSLSNERADIIPIMFKENRKFDLHIGKQVLVFKGRETKYISKKYLEHRDFLQVKDKFIIKGVV